MPNHIKQISIRTLLLLLFLSAFGLGSALAKAPITQTDNQLTPHSEDGTLYGYVDLAGQWVIEPQFEYAANFSEDLAAVTINQKQGYIDPTGAIAIEPQFDFAADFSEGLAAVTVEGKTGFIDPTGQMVVEPQFDFANSFSEGLAAVTVEGKTGYIDQTGQMVIEPQFEFGQEFSEGLAAVGVEGKIGYIDPAGTIVIEPQFEFGYGFTEGLAVVGVEQKSGFIDPTGEMVIEPRFDFASSFSEGLAAVGVEGRTGYIDPAGEMVIEAQFDYGDLFSEGLAAVSIEGQTGYIDPTGQMVIEPQFTSGQRFENGRAYVTLGGAWGYIDQTGQLLLELPFPPIKVSLTGMIDYLPSVPAETREGSCFTNSLIVPLASAWRCTVGNELFDPCLVGDDGQTLVCGADPVTTQPGFQLTLTEPLPEPEAAPVATSEVTGEPLSAEALENGEYLLPEWSTSGTVQLTGGAYEVSDASAMLLVKMAEVKAFGDLNGDGLEDAAVVLLVNGGGSGTFYYLAAVINEAGQPNNAATTLLGDRIELKSIAIDAGEVVVDAVTQGPEDPMCCPTQAVTQRYRLQEGELIAGGESAWLLQLADGATCSFATGATGVIEDKRINYTCSDDSVIIGDLQPGIVWTAEKVVLDDQAADPFTVKETKMVDILTIWQPVDPAQLLPEIGLAPDQVSLETGELAQQVRGQIRPGIPYNPEVPPSGNGEPAHLRFVFDEDILPEGGWVYIRDRQLLIYSVEPYRAIHQAAGSDEVNNRIATLESLLADRPQTMEGDIPVLPVIGASQVIRSQINYLDFAGGSGIRFITHYAQDPSPITNESIAYVFQGLTDDGKYYVSMFYPVSASVLPDTYEDTPAITDFDAFIENFETYLQETTQALDELEPAGFTPDLTELDAMVESLQIGQ